MRTRAESASYDVIVVGGGVGGLVAGGLMAKAGRSVLVVEAEDAPGGFARSFTSDGASFDLADHLIMSCGADGPFGEGLLHQILASLGVVDRVEFVAVDPFYAVDYQGDRFVLPGGRAPHIAALCDYFPREGAGVRALFGDYDEAYREMAAMPIQPRVRDAVRIPWHAPLVFRERKHTLGELLDEHIRDPVLRTVHTALWPYLGLPPSRASALAWASMMASYVGEGAFYPVGGFQRLADAFADGLRQQGGELVCGHAVAAIRADRGAVTGITMEDGSEIAAPVVIANIDPRIAFGPMAGDGKLPRRYRHQLERGEVSMSVYALYLTVNMDLLPDEVAHETAVMTADSERTYWRGVDGDICGVIVTIPTLTDRSRSPTAHHTVVVKAQCPSGEGPDRGEIADTMLELASRVVPDLRDAVTHVHGRTENASWPLRRLGPIYGWAMTPSQIGYHRLGHETPVAGLYLSGHWTQPVAGVWGAAASGVQLVRILLESAPHDGVVPIRL